MKILALDTSSQAASCALLEDERPIGSFYIDAKLTHSQTILPMVENMLSACQQTLKDVDLFAVSNGPGSFTGLRIGTAAVKGMAHALNKPCVGLSTLEGLAYNMIGRSGIVCAVMDARCNQVYTALFDLDEGMKRITEDMAIPLEELQEILKKQEKNVVLVGDGAVLCYNSIVEEDRAKISLSPAHQRLQNAYSVGLAVLQGHQNEAAPARELQPSYLRLPQAQRELLKKQQK
ncbi:MAG: tRNA (adenosine(37)-N6)-threonylcarbamoyltransferase complex dimerization subunit type 1 TsaB [Oscillospiraceae bacterium]|nr:tRNA (adenosine(37)-N6)-threonylcarbamoyltransferase complex dimerization subunit type 1 TsaB [Oscillospiraceae bacterium]